MWGAGGGNRKRETEVSRLGSLKAEKLIILPVFFDVMCHPTERTSDGWVGAVIFGVSGGRCVWRDG